MSEGEPDIRIDIPLRDAQKLLEILRTQNPIPHELGALLKGLLASALSQLEDPPSPSSHVDSGTSPATPMPMPRTPAGWPVPYNETTPLKASPSAGDKRERDGSPTPSGVFTVSVPGLRGSPSQRPASKKARSTASARTAPPADFVLDDDESSSKGSSEGASVIGSDSSYNPASERKLQPTPAKRANTDRSAPQSLHGRAQQISPQQGRCLITNVSEPKCQIQLSHVIARAANNHDDLMKNLELGFQMPRNTLNIDTRRNVVFLAADLHLMADGAFWALLPHFKAIEKVCDYVDNLLVNWPPLDQRVPIIKTLYPSKKAGKRRTWKYYLVPLDESMKKVNIYRRLPGTTAEDDLHEFPYHHLQLESHVYPHYAIFAMGQKLAHICNGALMEKKDRRQLTQEERAALYDTIIPWMNVGRKDDSDPGKSRLFHANLLDRIVTAYGILCTLTDSDGVIPSDYIQEWEAK